MANKERGEQQFVAGDQTYVLRLTTAAACEVETRSGKTLRDLQVGATVRGSITDSCWLLWASLQDHHADTVKTLKDIHRIVDAAGGLQAINEQLEAFMTLNAAPDPHGNGTGPDRPPDAQPRTPGVDSTSTPAPSA
jgi:hypothetical protein